MSTRGAYQEQWPGEEIIAESVLGTAASNEVEALAAILKFQMGTKPALKARSDAARRDWCKISRLKYDLKKKFEAETASGDTDTALAESEDDKELPGLRCTICSLIVPHTTDAHSAACRRERGLPEEPEVTFDDGADASDDKDPQRTALTEAAQASREAAVARMHALKAQNEEDENRVLRGIAPPPGTVACIEREKANSTKPAEQHHEEDIDFGGVAEDIRHMQAGSDETSVYEACSDSGLETVNAAKESQDAAPVSAADVPPPPPTTYMELKGGDGMTYKGQTINGTERSPELSGATSLAGFSRGRSPSFRLGKSPIGINVGFERGNANRAKSDRAVSLVGRAPSTARSARSCTRADGAKVPDSHTKTLQRNQRDLNCEGLFELPARPPMVIDQEPN